MEIGLQDALQQFNIGKGAWYGWTDSSLGMIYSNLKLLDDTATMPSEDEVNAKIAELQVIENRRSGYPAIGDQLDMLFHAIDGDETLKTQFADFHTALKAIKDQYPKG